MIFSYKGINKFGKKESGRIDAKDLQEAYRKLKELGVFVEKLKEQKEGSFLDDLRLSIFARYNKITPTYLSALAKELSIYLKSGISLINAISLLKEQQESKKQEQFMTQIHKMLTEGNSFSYSLKKQAIFVMPEYFIKTVEASESGGTLDKVLAELSELIKKNYEIEKNISNAMIYPAFIFIMSFVILIFLINYVVPKISLIFEQLNQELPLSTQIVISVGNFMQDYGFYMASVLLVLILIVSVVVKRSRDIRYKIDTALLKLPLLGKFFLVSELARFSNLFSSLLNSGVPVVQSIVLASQTFRNLAMQEYFGEIKDRVVEGKSISKALSSINKSEVVPKSFIHSISIGESSGNLSEMLGNISELYSFEVQNRQEKFLALLEPAVILFMGLVVGFIVVSMLLPVFNINFSGV
ncbi:MAG: type II secretion system F family protein [Campylobacterales bacterium]